MNSNSFTQGIINILSIFMVMLLIMFIGATFLTKFQTKQILDGFLLMLGIIISIRLFKKIRK